MDSTSTSNSRPSRQYLSMAFSPSSPNLQKSTTNMAVSQLLTPEEPTLDSFERKPTLPPMHSIVPSPPASPAFTSFNAGVQERSYSQPDRILFPDVNTTAAASPDQPLFSSPSLRFQSPPAGSASPSPRIRQDTPFSNNVKLDTNGESTSSNTPRVKSMPVGPVTLNNEYGPEYYRFMMAQVEGHRAAMRAHRQLPPLADTSRVQSRDRYSQQQVSSLGRTTRIEKSKPEVKAAPKPKVVKPVPAIKAESQAKRSRRQALSPELPTVLGGWQQSPAPKPRTRAAPSKKVDDKDYSEWASIPDYSPPTSSLEQMSKKLSATWNNSNSLNLENDPDKQYLHPQEYEISSTLRLKCNQYLASKRRIFAAKVKALSEGREFNKTSAQNCCTIDVNKASRLWMAFDGVGWFDDHWFQQHLN